MFINGGDVVDNCIGYIREYLYYVCVCVRERRERQTDTHTYRERENIEKKNILAEAKRRKPPLD
jgi:ribosomal protein L9